MASPPPAAAALAPQVPRPQAFSGVGVGIGVGQTGPQALGGPRAWSGAQLLLPAPSCLLAPLFCLHPGVSSFPIPSPNLESQSANASERPPPARSESPAGDLLRSEARTATGNVRVAMESALVEEVGAGWGSRGNGIFGLPELTATSCVPSPPENILSVAFCLPESFLPRLSPSDVAD